MLDMDGNGRITKSDLEAVFKKNSSTDTNEALEEIIQEADVNGTGEIAFNDFKKLMLMMQRQAIVMRPD